MLAFEVPPCYAINMKRICFLALTGVLGGAGTLAQQSQPATAGVTLPLVQAAGGTAAGGANDRPGGISHVTRQRSTVGNINLANSFWAAGGVRVVTAAGTAGISSTAPVTSGAVAARPTAPARPAMDPRAVAVLRQLAARGDVSAKQALAAVTAGVR